MVIVLWAMTTMTINHWQPQKVHKVPTFFNVFLKPPLPEFFSSNQLTQKMKFSLNESSPYSSVPLWPELETFPSERPPWFWMNATEYSGPLPSPLEYCNRPRPFVSHFLKKIWRNNLNECNGIFRSPHLQYCNRPFPFVRHYLYLFEVEM